MTTTGRRTARRRLTDMANADGHAKDGLKSIDRAILSFGDVVWTLDDGGSDPNPEEMERVAAALRHVRICLQCIRSELRRGVRANARAFEREHQVATEAAAGTPKEPH